MTRRVCRSRAAKIVLRYGAALLALTCADQVIAADDAGEQPASEIDAVSPTPMHADATAEPVASAWPTALEVAMVIAAIAVLIVFFRKRWHDFRSVPLRSIGFSPMVGLALFIGLLILPQLGQAAAMSACGIDPAAQPLSLSDHAKLMIGAYAAQMIGVIAFVILQTNAHQVSQSQGNRAQFGAIKSIGFAVAAIIMTMPVLVMVEVIVRPIAMAITGKPIDPIAHESLRMFLANDVDGWYITLAAMAVVAAPIIEEVMYRGVLQTALVRARLARWSAIAVSSAAFASAHGTVDVHALPLLFVLSLSFGWAYERTGRLLVPIVMHALFNAANLALALLTY